MAVGQRTSAEPGRFGALRSRNFAILWFGNLLSNVGSWMQQVAEPWLVLQITNSPFLVGLDAFASDAPIWVLILAGGILADHRDRRAVIGFFQGIQALCPLILVALLWAGKVHVSVVIGLSLVVGITDALSMPSIQALVPSTVSDDRVASAVALNSAQFNLSRVLGPLAAGATMAAFGAIACFGANAVSYVPFLASIALLSLPASASLPRAAHGPRRAWRELLEALGLVQRTPTLRRALLTVASNGLFCTALITFAPVIVRDAFHRQSAAFGGSLSVYGLGGILGAGLVLLFTDNASRLRLSTFAALAVGLLTILVALSPSFALFVALFFLVGTGIVATNASANAVLQSSIGSELRGRISSLYSLALRGSTALGSLFTGLLVARAGIRAGLLVDGALALTLQ
ncbi:MAG TPA: MFS transporter, partial [Myxococcales bacterium]|nr:MFS transporter [Myxococcales bacterium]